MNPTEIIRKKRDGGTLSRDEINRMIQGYLDGSIPEYQLSAFLMAVYFQKMNFEETTILTDIMLHSGIVINLKDLPGIKVDKHSTGGVGDKVSIILAPMVAACGVPVPMISGRGLGHTGGTLDKLESIPGFRTTLNLEEYRKVIAEAGVVMIGQTAEIAPADKRLYALRDVTGTVECIPLISSSIMSKKLAEGIDALVLDIKTGRGAFMATEADAVRLSETLVAVGTMFGVRTIGFITDMSQPLGRAVGNWNEIVECIECLRGADVPDLMEVTLTLGAGMVMLGGKAGSIAEGKALCKEAIASGRAWEKFLQMVRLQGGDVAAVENPASYPRSAVSMEVRSSSDGFVGAIDALEVGFTGIMVGAGRMTVEERIDPKAGIMVMKKVGDRVKKGDILATLGTDRTGSISSAASRLEKAFSITAAPPEHTPLIRSFVDSTGVHPVPR
jgi:pyrimidine-nucleoside phosphorylase